ncbi:ISAs1 family transposase [Photorhabdus khanii]|uniref:H repeat-associated protein N-terminal domain-containing protein n=1 Tax=Photorhabdus khanii subsp. guanajuatensis TaxID=2100166 RepID=A0A4R4J3R9_9GAMM|nr:ISAs1 family transposase [Photorhabdus khanii]TDB48164.1 hypothetical protein C5467_19555 [Photorhabdus khanii subsp. guanajuatensis]
MTLMEHLSVVKETRSETNRKYDLIDVIFLVISAIMAGAEGWQDIETYGNAKIKWLRTYRPFLSGIPCRHTIARIAKKWPTIRSIIAVERHRTRNGKGTVDTSHYVSSFSLRHKLLGHSIRQHWRIGNSQHYILDVVFKEDDSRIVLDGAIENLALFRRFVLNMLKQCDCGAPSQRNKLKKAGWSDDYRARVFFG